MRARPVLPRLARGAHLPLLALLGVVASACGDSSAGPPAPASAVARFAPSDPAAAAMDWGDVPFPSDLYRDGAGTIRIGALPTPLSDAPLLAAMRELFAARDGFCATCNAYFAIDGDLDRDQLAELADLGEEGAGAEPSPDDPIVLADVDPGSPERGRLFRLRVEWNPDARVLAVRPVRGIALRRSRRYAAAITSGLRAADGTPLAADAAFARVRHGRAGGDPALARAIEVVGPALDELADAGVDRDAVVAVAAFTTEDVTADVLSARAAVQAGPPIAGVVTRVIAAGSDLDDLLGVPSEDRPGIDVPPAPGTAGTRSIVHRSIAAVLVGELAAPRIVSGSGTEIGTVLRDESGAVAAGPREAVPFVLTIPAVADRTRLPVAVAHHGFNASRTTGFATAETAARVGVAVLAIDAFQHGDRAASRRDRVHAMRGDVPGPDGFAETEPLDVSGRVFGVLGAAPGLEGYTGYSHGTLLQFSADVASTVRFVREGGLDAAIAAALGGGALVGPVSLDATRIGFIGNSLGAVVGAAALVAEPDLRAGVQNVQPGSIVETLAESPEFRPLVESVFLPLLGLSAAAFDEVERHLVLDPVIDLTRWALEPVDPLALAPYVERDRVVPGPAPQVLFQVASLDEVASVLATRSMLAAGAFSRVTRYDPAAHGMLEVVDQVSRFEPPAAPPYRRREADLAIANPIAAEHLEIEDFLTRSLVGAP